MLGCVTPERHISYFLEHDELHDLKKRSVLGRCYSRSLNGQPYKDEGSLGLLVDASLENLSVTMTTDRAGIVTLAMCALPSEAFHVLETEGRYATNNGGPRVKVVDVSRATAQDVLRYNNLLYVSSGSAHRFAINHTYNEPAATPKHDEHDPKRGHAYTAHRHQH